MYYTFCGKFIKVGIFFCHGQQMKSRNIQAKFFKGFLKSRFACIHSRTVSIQAHTNPSPKIFQIIQVLRSKRLKLIHQSCQKKNQAGSKALKREVGPNSLSLVHMTTPLSQLILNIGFGGHGRTTGQCIHRVARRVKTGTCKTTVLP